MSMDRWAEARRWALWVARSLVSIRGSGEPSGEFGPGGGTPDFF